MFSQYSIDTIDRGVTDKFLEFILYKEGHDIIMEYDVKGRAEVTIFILVMSSLADSVRELPGIPRFTIRISYILFLRLLHILMEADVNECFLVEVLLIDIAD